MLHPFRQRALDGEEPVVKALSISLIRPLLPVVSRLPEGYNHGHSRQESKVGDPPHRRGNQRVIRILGQSFDIVKDSKHEEPDDDGRDRSRALPAMSHEDKLIMGRHGKDISRTHHPSTLAEVSP